jgi:hypothetical protein
MITMDQADTAVIDTAGAVLLTTETVADEAQGTTTTIGIILEIPGIDATTMIAAGRGATAGAATDGKSDETANLETCLGIDPASETGIDPGNDPVTGPEDRVIDPGRGHRHGNDPGRDHEKDLGIVLATIEEIDTLAEGAGSIDRGALGTAVAAVRATTGRSGTMQIVTLHRRGMLLMKELTEFLMQSSQALWPKKGGCSIVASAVAVAAAVRGEAGRAARKRSTLVAVADRQAPQARFRSLF